MVIGDDQKYLVALIVPDAEQLSKELAPKGLRPDDPVVLAMYRERIDACLAEVSHQEQVGQFALLNRGFTIEGGHLTPKASLRREIIAQDFANEIAELYSRKKQ